MTEPVAYWNIPQFGNDEPFVGFEPYDGNVLESIPLYTSEQLHPRVKMTHEEFDEFKSIKALSTSVFTAINLITKTDNYKQLKVSSGITNGFNNIDWQNDFVYSFINFTFSNPEETIEIIPDMKWFVRSKEKNGDRYLYLKKPDGFVTPWYTVFKDLARHFDTEEEAELWNNPQTEAVQLPVEEER